MTTLYDIETPHEVRDEDKLSSLVETYETSDVSPPVVLSYYDDFIDATSCYAISGSHRLAAMAEVFGAGVDVEGLVIVVDSADVIAAAEAAGDDNALMIANREERWSDFDTIVEALLPYLPAEAQAALADQH